MSDEELIARLRLYGSKFHHEFGHNDAADRIEALTAKLAKTAKVALAYEDWVTDAYDLLEGSLLGAAVGMPDHQFVGRLRVGGTGRKHRAGGGQRAGQPGLRRHFGFLSGWVRRAVAR